MSAQFAVVDRNRIADAEVVKDLSRCATGLVTCRFRTGTQIAAKQDLVSDYKPIVFGRRRDSGDAHFRSGNVHQNWNSSADRPLGCMDICNHARPAFLVVMRAIDPHSVGAVPAELNYEFGGGCSLLIKRYQNTAATRRLRPENKLSVASEHPLSAKELERRGDTHIRRTFFSRQRFQGNGYRVQRCEHVPFCAAERGEPKRHKLSLQLAQIGLPECQVLCQVEGAGTEIRPFYQ